ncbi:DUF84 family protein [Caldithrix abyssi]
MKIGIGSLNKTKVEAVKSACAKLQQTFPYLQNQRFEFVTMGARTPIPDMPLSQEQIIDGAVLRAQYVFKQVPDLDYAIGLEGGTFPLTTPALSPDVLYFLQNWVYVYNGQTGSLGSSPALPLPGTIVRQLYEERRELAEVIDEFSGRHDVRSNQGAFGILTRQLLSRTHTFEISVINAFIPFLNPDYA